MNIKSLRYQDAGQNALILIEQDEKRFSIPWPCNTWHNGPIQEWLAAGNEIAPAPAAVDELTQWRESTAVSRLQAKQALDDFGHLDQVETIIAGMPDTPEGRKTKRAWVEAMEFRRMSPTIIELLGLLELTPEQGDELFTHALTLEF